MDMEKSLAVGDTVDVFFTTLDAIFRAEIVYIPCAAGDCFKLIKDGKKYNVQNYGYMCESAEQE